MPGAINTYGDIGNATAGWYSKRLLSHAVPVIILERFGLIRTLPRNQTKIIEFRRPLPFPAATTPLVEGVTPPGSSFGYDQLTVQIQQYGDWTALTDVVEDTSKDRVLRDMSMMQGEQIGNTRELLTWSIVRAGTNVQYGGAISTRATVDQTSLLTAGMQRSAISAMHRQKAKKFNLILDSSINYKTQAIEASYVGIAHTDMIPTIRELRGVNSDRNAFIPVAQYGQMQPLSPHEIGAFEEVRYICSPDLTPFLGAGAAENASYRSTGGKFDVYPLLILGREAFGCIPLRGKNAVRPLILRADVPAKGDELAQRGSVGWKMWFACLVLNEMWMRRLEVACPK